MNKLINIIFILLIVACSPPKRTTVTNILTISKLTPLEIKFSKKDLGYESIFLLQVPNCFKTTSQTFGGHGYGFTIEDICIDSTKRLLLTDTLSQADMTLIYYTNDWAVTTSNYVNYKSIGWQGFDRSNPIDTALEGIQDDGRCWKEIKKGSDYLGYINVLQKDKLLFDQCLESFQKIK